MSAHKTDLFDVLASESSLSELGIDKPQVIRAIEAINAMGYEVNPGNVALELGVPKSFLYADLDILEIVYKSTKTFTGHDKLILSVINKLKSAKRKVNKLEKQIIEKDKELEKSFTDGFAKGAAMNFSKQDDTKKEIPADSKETWARGLLGFGFDDKLSDILIRKKYRLLISLIHPDKTGKDTGDMVHMLKEAADILLEDS